MKNLKLSFFVLTLIVLMSLAYGFPSVADSCQNNEIQITVNSNPLPNGQVYCLPVQEQIIECSIYNQDGTCYQCPENSSLQYMTTRLWISGGGEILDKRSACIPYSQQVLNCLQYSYSPTYVQRFVCALCPYFFLIQFDFVDNLVDNSKGITKACTFSKIEGCIQYIETGQFDGIPLVACKTCSANYHLGSGSYYLLIISIPHENHCVRNVQNIDCARFISWGGGISSCLQSSTCGTAIMTFSDGPYYTLCPNQTINSAVLEYCAVYNRYSQNPEEIKCLTCPSFLQYTDYYQKGQNQISAACIFSLQPHGCKKFIEPPNAQLNAKQLICLQCTSDYEMFPLSDSQRPEWLSNQQQIGFCMKKGRFNLEQSPCKTFQYPGFQHSLQCTTCKNPNMNPPCITQPAECSQNLAYVKILDLNGQIKNSCITLSMLTDNCDIYKSNQDQSSSKCIKCVDGYQLANAKINYIFSQNTAVCIKTTQVIPNCLFYDFFDFTICKDITDHRQILIPHCIQYNITNHSQCLSCTKGWSLNQQNISCLIDLSNCTLIDKSKNPPTCLSCKSGFVLVNFQFEGQSDKLCLPSTDFIPHCNLYTSFYVSGQNHYSCKACNTANGYSLINVNKSDVTIQKCGLTRELVDNCKIYSQFAGSCNFKCDECMTDYRLGNVKYAFRIQQKCLKVSDEYLPNCDLYLEANGAYYCRPGHCEEPSLEIPIGTEQKQLACTTFGLLPQGKCLYYERPNLNSLELRCAHCLEPLASGPTCMTTQ